MIYGVYAAYAAYGWDPRILRTGVFEAKVMGLAPTSSITDIPKADNKDIKTETRGTATPQITDNHNTPSQPGAPQGGRRI